MVARAPLPSAGVTGTSRQPRTVRPSWVAISSIVRTASVEPSAGRKAIPTAYEPASGSSKGVSARRKASGTWHRILSAVAGVGLGAGGAAVFEVAQYGQRLLDQLMAGHTGQSGHEPDATGVVLVTGSYIPCWAGRPSMGDQASIRIGSPVVVVAFAVPRDDVGPLRNFVQVT